MASSTIRAKVSFAFVNADGVPVSINEGETFASNAKRLKGVSKETLAENFEDFSPDHGLEQATSKPGEKRRK